MSKPLDESFMKGANTNLPLMLICQILRPTLTGLAVIFVPTTEPPATPGSHVAPSLNSLFGQVKKTPLKGLTGGRKREYDVIINWRCDD